MKEIKFRAWDKEKNKMLFDFLLTSDGNAGFIDMFERWNTLWDVELMQYTGVKDKNGKEIYEGDIIKFGKSTFTVKYCKEFASFKKFFSDDCVTDLINIPELYEVIGNIFENPELLEQESEN